MLCRAFPRMIWLGACVGEGVEFTVGPDQLVDCGAGARLHLADGDFAYRLVTFVTPSVGGTSPQDAEQGQ